MQPKWMLGCSVLLLALPAYSQIIEIDGSPFSTHNAPMPEYIKRPMEKVILINPAEHVWGAYSAQGKLIRWGIATAGADTCRDSNGSCRTKTGMFRIYSLGSSNCVSNKYPLGTGGASMPYCMYFYGSQALHGSYEVTYENSSHGCVRVHVDDAKWLRYHFVEAPNTSNQYRGTQVIVQSY